MRNFSGRAERRTADVERRLRAALTELGPLLRLEDAAFTLVGYDAAERVAVLRAEGTCAHCDLSVATFRTAVEAHIQRTVPEVRAVRLADD